MKNKKKKMMEKQKIYLAGGFKSDWANEVKNCSDNFQCFSVHTYSIINENSPMYAHWSEGLKMIIVKDGVTLKLNSEEIEQLVKALPRTVGGSY